MRAVAQPTRLGPGLALRSPPHKKRRLSLPRERRKAMTPVIGFGTAREGGQLSPVVERADRRKVHPVQETLRTWSTSMVENKS